VENNLSIAVYVILGVYWAIIISFIYMVRREWYLNFKRDDSMEE